MNVNSRQNSEQLVVLAVSVGFGGASTKRVEASTRLEHDVGASRSLYWALEQPNRCWKLPVAPDICLTGQATTLRQQEPEATVLLPDSA